MASINRPMRIANIVPILFVALIPLEVYGAEVERISERELGKLPDGRVVKIFTLKNKNGVIVRLSNWGATITEIHIPDKNGKFTNVVVGFDDFERIVKGPTLGSTIGRFANRIAGARFKIDGIEYKVTANSGTNHIHGGRRGFDKVLWDATPLAAKSDRASVQFTYLSPDGEEGYPGNLTVKVTMTLTDDNELQLLYEARTDKATVVNLTNHSYFNLAGYGNVLNHQLLIAANNYTPTDDQLIPTGEIASVKGTPLDFTTPHKIGERIEQLMPRPGGYDHNYVLNREGKPPYFAARLTEPESGRIMEVFTTQPGMQFYTANHFNGKIIGVGGVAFPKHGAICFETQHFPDSPNKPNFPSTVLRPGEKFENTTIFKFSKI
ncbi:MAG TPA: aldose epimerase family protein [Verrucomicrobiota bacterium]|nr:aldose epimerase family protein [Verrucomicrobiota bacterium]